MKQPNLKPLKAKVSGLTVSPVPPTYADAVAIQALALGKANDGQQKHALDWILKKACSLGEWPYRESMRETDVTLGRQFAGQQIVAAIKINVSQLKNREEMTNA